MLLPPNGDAEPTAINPPRRHERQPWRGPASLSERIHQRILRRLNDRVRDLEVQVAGDRIILRGRCATYYSKQLAQHAALGAIEDESLENAIEVSVNN